MGIEAPENSTSFVNKQDLQGDVVAYLKSQHLHVKQRLPIATRSDVEHVGIYDVTIAEKS